MDKKTDNWFDKIEDRIISVDDNQTTTNIILGIGLGILIILSIMSYGKLSELTKQEIIVDAFVDEGYVQRIGKDSVIVNDKPYSGICNDDLDLLLVGDKILVEDSRKVDGWINQCDKYRITIQKPNPELHNLKVADYNSRFKKDGNQ